MSIERTPENVARFYADMQRIASRMAPLVCRMTDHLWSATLADGTTDFYRVCNEHRWASRGDPYRPLAEHQQCPDSKAERLAGERRYRVLADAVAAERKAG